MSRHPFGRKPHANGGAGVPIIGAGPSLEQQVAQRNQEVQRKRVLDQLLGGMAMRCHAEDVCMPNPARGWATVQIVPIDTSSGGIAMPDEAKTVWLVLIESSGVFDTFSGPVEVNIPLGSRLLMEKNYSINTNFDLPPGVAMIRLDQVAGVMPEPTDARERRERATQ